MADLTLTQRRLSRSSANISISISERNCLLAAPPLEESEGPPFSNAIRYHNVKHAHENMSCTKVVYGNA